jgi:N-acetylglucosamine kinase-like BadF-type ATPase
MVSGTAVRATVALGIDTGGTYTDAALVDQSNGVVLASAKALTTYHDLSVGIGQAVVAAFAAADEEAPGLPFADPASGMGVREGAEARRVAPAVRTDRRTTLRSDASPAFGGMSASARLDGGGAFSGVAFRPLRLRRLPTHCSTP